MQTHTGPLAHTNALCHFKLPCLFAHQQLSRVSLIIQHVDTFFFFSLLFFILLSSSSSSSFCLKGGEFPRSTRSIFIVRQMKWRNGRRSNYRLFSPLLVNFLTYFTSQEASNQLIMLHLSLSLPCFLYSAVQLFIRHRTKHIMTLDQIIFHSHLHEQLAHIFSSVSDGAISETISIQLHSPLLLPLLTPIACALSLSLLSSPCFSLFLEFHLTAFALLFIATTELLPHSWRCCSFSNNIYTCMWLINLPFTADQWARFTFVYKFICGNKACCQLADSWLTRAGEEREKSCHQCEVHFAHNI